MIIFEKRAPTERQLKPTMSQRSSRDPYPTTATSDEIAEASDVVYDKRTHPASELLRKWSAEDDGYDDEIWPLVEEELEDHRVVIE